MKSILIIFIKFLAIGVKLSPAIVLECDFVHHRSYWGNKYACIATNLETTVDNRTITQVKGNHIAGKTNDDVEKFLVTSGKCPVLPLNLGKFFTNLEVFYVMKSAVKTLTNQDLKGLDKLKIFDVSYNPIERIESGYFDGKSSVKIISFYKCALKFVNSSALDPLMNLEQGHFEYNHCIDYRGDQKHLLPTLKRHLKNCDGTRNDIDFYPAPPPDSELDAEESQPRVAVEESTDAHASTTESRVHDVHYINECQTTFVGRNAFEIILLLVFIITVGIIVFGVVHVQYRTEKLHQNSIRLNENF